MKHCVARRNEFAPDGPTRQVRKHSITGANDRQRRRVLCTIREYHPVTSDLFRPPCITEDEAAVGVQAWIAANRRDEPKVVAVCIGEEHVPVACTVGESRLAIRVTDIDIVAIELECGAASDHNGIARRAGISIAGRCERH